MPQAAQGLPLSKALHQNLPAGTMPFLSWHGQAPTMVLLTTSIINNIVGLGKGAYWLVNWGLGADNFPIMFQVSDPITLYAKYVTVYLVNPNAGMLSVGAGDLFASATLAEVAAASRPARPLWMDPAQTDVNLAFGATGNFRLQTNTRRFRVARHTPATPFTVIMGTTGFDEQAVTAGNDFPWREAPSSDRNISVVNNAAAGNDNFSLEEELGL